MAENFCTACGAPLMPGAEARDSHPRCSLCGRVQYRNPVVRVACIAQNAHLVEPLLWCTALGEREKIQAAALRLLGGGDAHREEDLSLYATITDQDSESLFLVFRVRGGTSQAAQEFPVRVPPWASSLLARYAIDERMGYFSVYNGCFDGDRLELHAVADDR
jgi:hypothetical protein